MNNEFVMEIRDRVAMELAGKTVEVREVEKANGVMFTGLSIRTEGCNIAPTIYLNENATVDENVDYVLNAYANCQQGSDVDVSWVQKYENVKDKLGIMLTSKPIKGVAKRKAPGFDDLYMHAYILINNDSLGGMGNIKVTDEMLKTWGITNAELFKDARKSAPNVAPAKLQSMFAALLGLGMPADMIPMPEDDDPMKVLTTEKGALGASAILYTKVKENTYMIPSSIHEVLLIDGNSEVAHGNLNSMINEVNTTTVAPEEVLSNHAYRYNGKKWESVA